MRTLGAANLILIVATSLIMGCKPANPLDSSELSIGPGDIVLPLREGFYVPTDISCDAASNATFVLVHAGGFSGSRDFCSFLSIQQTGPSRFLVTEQCSDVSMWEPGEPQTVEYLVIDDSHFSATTPDGRTREARYCEQARLPEPWGENFMEDFNR